MLGTDDVDEELQRGFWLSISELEPLLKAGGDAAEMKFMECCRYLWEAEGAELTEPFIDAAFNKLPEKSRCVLFQRMLTIVYVHKTTTRNEADGTSPIRETAALRDFNPAYGGHRAVRNPAMQQIGL
jgi:hypothetical protein